MEILLLIVLTAVQSAKSLGKYIKAKNYKSVARFVLAFAFSIVLVLAVPNSNILNVQELEGMSTFDLVSVGIVLGFASTGSKDLLNTFFKGGK